MIFFFNDAATTEILTYLHPRSLHDALPIYTVNATIGQGYMLVNPTQLAVMAARLATGNIVMPHLTQDANRAPVQSLGFAPDHIGVVREAMNQVVNGLGTAGSDRLPVEDVKMAGKTGTAQVVSLSKGSGKGGPWKD